MGTIAFALGIVLMVWSREATTWPVTLVIFGFCGGLLGMLMVDPGASDSLKTFVVIVQGLPWPVFFGRRSSDVADDVDPGAGKRDRRDRRSDQGKG